MTNMRKVGNLGDNIHFLDKAFTFTTKNYLKFTYVLNFGTSKHDRFTYCTASSFFPSSLYAVLSILPNVDAVAN